MDEVEKLLNKISKREREAVEEVIALSVSGRTKKLNIKKIANSCLFRVKAKRFRIIYHFDYSEVIIDTIRIRDKNTYKNLPKI
ncbi:MAG: hypothetical protein WCW77_04735 [Patescibacteria group bacterium]|jgi:mRNA-degrading endonuclease RelE of RelBE toxin-antitoxin system